MYKSLFDGEACGLPGAFVIVLERDEVLWWVLLQGGRMTDKQGESERDKPTFSIDQQNSYA
jgi:hypothetical protein